jgi:probable addiction module antidote protein
LQRRDINKARRMAKAQVAKDSELGRESVYKALAAEARPRFETTAAVMRALNVRFAIGAK